jgi:hypothetical protein
MQVVGPTQEIYAAQLYRVATMWNQEELTASRKGRDATVTTAAK